MNQSPLISIIIGGIFAKQVQLMSIPDASSVNLHMQGSLLASMQSCTHPAMPGTACHNHKNNTFSKYCSSHLQPGALICIESHDHSTAWLQPCHWSSAVSARNIWCGFVDARLIARFNADLYTPCHARYSISQSENFGFSKVQLITSAARYTDFHRVPWFCIISTAWLQQYHWSSRCLYTQHLMWICGCKAHCSLQYRPLHPLPCPVQHVTITKHYLFKVQLITSAARCADLHRVPLLCVIFTSWPQQCHWSSAVSTRSIWCGFVDARLIARFNTDLSTPCHARYSMSQSKFYFIFKVQLITSAARCTDLHRVPWLCVIFTSWPQQCHWSSAVSAHNIWCGFVDARFIARFNADLDTPCHARYSMKQSRKLWFFQSTAHHICSQVHWLASSPMILYHFRTLTATVPLI